MTINKVPMITDLSEEERKSMQERIEKLLVSLNDCGSYPRNYAAGTQNVAKLFGVMCWTEDAIVEVRDELSKVHPATLPPKWRRSDG
ncbi:MAG TPA: hypothetical protein VKH18_05025 [Terriglobales bacterium]|nr:hypothetical protein [Terriglobales bacterium]